MIYRGRDLPHLSPWWLVRSTSESPLERCCLVHHYQFCGRKKNRTQKSMRWHSMGRKLDCVPTKQPPNVVYLYSHDFYGWIDRKPCVLHWRTTLCRPKKTKLNSILLYCFVCFCIRRRCRSVQTLAAWKLHYITIWYGDFGVCSSTPQHSGSSCDSNEQQIANKTKKKWDGMWEWAKRLDTPIICIAKNPPDSPEDALKCFRNER